MSLRDLKTRIEVRAMLRRANRVLTTDRARRTARAHLNRPHRQSDFMVGYPIIQPLPATARDCGITPAYCCAVALVLIGMYMGAPRADGRTEHQACASSTPAVNQHCKALKEKS